MADSETAMLAPVRGRARIDVLDMLRGLAILGILFINVPYMAAPVARFSADARSIGWSGLDQIAWGLQYMLWSGTQRCVLQFLFGAGMMVLTAKAMEPDGPVAIADLYYRRNLWLLAFGLVDVILLFWPGDILHIYALAALFLFPFRKLGPKALVACGLVWALMVAVGIPEYGLREFAARTTLVEHVQAAETKQLAGHALTSADRQTLTDWRAQREMIHHPAETREAIVAEQQAHAGGLLPYAEHQWRSWFGLVQGWLYWSVIEAFCTMLIGIALWKWGVIQGERSRRFYLAMLLASYGVGFTLRGMGLIEELRFDDGPRTIWFTNEFARLAIGLGHVALINFAVQTRIGRAILEPFKATGRMAFSLYFLQQFIGMYVLFSPFGFNLWGRFGWAAMTAIALALIAFEVVLANLWMRWFSNGPMEWLWRSLAYVKWMPLRRPAGPTTARPNTARA
ncbi:DUF418 domain-containing protein [Sphingomonas koreensis]|nr:DUF418 domain-containing protein [Sphingomonas koreensis]